jgi:hypothetical protein
MASYYLGYCGHLGVHGSSPALRDLFGVVQPGPPPPRCPRPLGEGKGARAQGPLARAAAAHTSSSSQQQQQHAACSKQRSSASRIQLREAISARYCAVQYRTAVRCWYGLCLVSRVSEVSRACSAWTPRVSGVFSRDAPRQASPWASPSCGRHNQQDPRRSNQQDHLPVPLPPRLSKQDSERPTVEQPAGAASEHYPPYHLAPVPTQAKGR